MRKRILYLTLAMLATCSGVDAKWIITSPWQCTIVGTTIVCVYVPQPCPPLPKGVYCR